MEMAFKVKPCSRADIRRFTQKVRHFLGVSALNFPITKILDLLTRGDEKFNYNIVPDDELPMNVHACWDPSEYVMYIKESVYDGACEGKGRDRMTLAHELGHYLLHTDQYPKMCRAFSRHEIRAFESSEWQAKAFAAELLLPADKIVTTMSPEDLAEIYGVSVEAATMQLNILRKEKQKGG